MSIIAMLDNTLAMLESSVISRMRADFELSAGELQLYIGLFGVLTFGVFLINWFSDAFGRKKGLILLVFMMGVPAITLPLTPSGPAGLIPSMLLYSLIMLATQANSWEIPVVEEVSHQKRGLLGAIPFFIGLLPLYALLGEPIAVSMGSWKYSYAIIGGILFAIALVMLIFMKETNRWLEHKNEILEERKNVIKMLKKVSSKDWHYILLGALSYFIWSICFKLATLAGQPTFIALGLGDQFKTFLTIAGLLNIIGALISGIIMDRVSRRAALITGCVGAMASYILFGFTQEPVFYVLIFLFLPMILAYIIVYFLGEIFPTKIRSTCAGAVITLSRVSYIVGPALSGGLIIWLRVDADVSMWSVYWLIGGVLFLVPIQLQLLVKPFETRQKTLEEIEENR
jgi:MFS family permease